MTQKSFLPQQTVAGSIDGNKWMVTAGLQWSFYHWGGFICPYDSFERGPDTLVRTFMKLFISKDHWLKASFFPVCSLPILTMCLQYLGKKYKPECWGITSHNLNGRCTRPCSLAPCATACEASWLLCWQERKLIGFLLKPGPIWRSLLLHEACTPVELILNPCILSHTL